MIHINLIKVTSINFLNMNHHINKIFIILYKIKKNT
jgi:hypothetical protein